ncbi:DUF4880 domain-containing protein [Sphingomonas suaedae]|uniref:DUF4880 domain-containing protein n=1 Tax=Sphingomonas suaedae TaxID=2599297 RepID=A0A518RHG3_9SPHN|nr:FecR domain-containing protein [Sphingomonas suaedae]QDX26907.1 DUF4880 domain-containing protein [Sphingomonas suaedae]
MTRFLSQLTGDVHEDASFWYARLTSDVKSVEDDAAFDRWLAASPDHVRAYDEVCGLATRLDAIADTPRLAEIVLETRRFRTASHRLLAPMRITRRPAAVALAVALMGILTFAAVDTHLFHDPAETEAWKVASGARRHIVLSDGSRLVLGSDSQLKMRFTAGERNLMLEHGQLFIEVAHDPRRKLTVTANGDTVTAVGTAFDVRAHNDATTVTLMRGSVVVAGRGRSKPIRLKPGQQFKSSPGSLLINSVDADATTSWRTGLLQFDAQRLGDIVTQFNHNAAHSIRLADPRLAGLRVSGVFRANDPSGFAAALEPAYPITIERMGSGDLVLHYREIETAVARE